MQLRLLAMNFKLLVGYCGIKSTLNKRCISIIEKLVYILQVMKNKKDRNIYETPQMDFVELLLEQSILQTSGGEEDLKITIPTMGWDN